MQDHRLGADQLADRWGTLTLKRVRFAELEAQPAVDARRRRKCDLKAVFISREFQRSGSEGCGFKSHRGHVICEFGFWIFDLAGWPSGESGGLQIHRQILPPLVRVPSRSFSE